MELEEITKENSFCKLFTLTRKIKTSKDTFWVFLISFAVLFAFYSLRINSLSDVDKLIISASETLLTTSVSLIGFIFAAYVLFASMTDKELMRIMALHNHPDYDMSYLKLGHCNFIKIILDLLLLVAIAYVGKVILSTFPEPQSATDFYILIYVFLLAVYQAGFILVLMLCKSAIFNVYHSIMMSARWYAEEKAKEEQAQSDE